MKYLLPLDGRWEARLVKAQKEAARSLSFPLAGPLSPFVFDAAHPGQDGAGEGEEAGYKEAPENAKISKI